MGGAVCDYPLLHCVLTILPICIWTYTHAATSAKREAAKTMGNILSGAV